MTHPLASLAAARATGQPRGITSVCSAHPVVLDAALRHGAATGAPVLIEATCNQVNQDGGYTGLTPAAFRDMVQGMCARAGLPPDRLILGGDHLGPNPWKHLPAADAMARAETMVAAYAAAGFTKLHLDTSMGCAGEPAALPDDVTAARAARLATVAEAHAPGPTRPVYVIGTEVPVPGGATDGHGPLQVTAAQAVATTHAIHRDAFARAGQQAAFDRVIALVVQPGVEFGHDAVIPFVPDAARALSATLDTLPGLVFEAHSTDYQTPDALAALVTMGFAILKVGPWLTFALRQALYGLDAAADVLDGHAPRARLMQAMEDAMQAAPGTWDRYTHGDPASRFVQRHFGYSDRIRYSWPDAAAQTAVQALRTRVAGRTIPAPVLQQYLPALPPDTATDPDSLLRGAVTAVLDTYHRATQG
ncbi:MAG: class II D-tagatose-bisphosphate aldolase, non-catalytic subunit [Rhodobacteraceae bacterium]|nr:class II D-tagatose-bisphosphate aldolase, non-catalytic subunit [Paracoccaceae bacterium]